MVFIPEGARGLGRCFDTARTVGLLNVNRDGLPAQMIVIIKLGEVFWLTQREHGGGGFDL